MVDKKKRNCNKAAPLNKKDAHRKAEIIPIATEMERPPSRRKLFSCR